MASATALPDRYHLLALLWPGLLVDALGQEKAQLARPLLGKPDRAAAEKTVNTRDKKTGNHCRFFYLHTTRWVIRRGAASPARPGRKWRPGSTPPATAGSRTPGWKGPAGPGRSLTQ